MRNKCEPPMAEILDNRYVLREEHQSGGMASIYKARRLDNDEFVAINSTVSSIS
jgi:hypothetical protein